jgi:putative membrane protein
MSGTEKAPDILGEERWPAKAGNEGNQSHPLGSTQTHLAWMRTRMTLESTLAAWVRTATSLIAFGFAIVQFFEHFNETRGLSGQHLARYVGLVLIGTGSLATAVAVWDYHKALRYLASEAFRGVAGVPGLRRVLPAMVVAVLLCLVGLLAFFTILVGGELPWPGRS